MSHVRRVLLEILYDDCEVRAPYICLLKALVDTESDAQRPHAFFDGVRVRRGTLYTLGTDEVFWLQPSEADPEQLLIMSDRLRENLLDLLALHPMYAIWFGH